ncbi:pentatricopeptide repeat-containing protein At5g66520-like [Nicotiana tomentosiformis]|uniref:pentatricopeptide repeat-containing protein At5g66520-like n=1 Tax=Nicotiana tomentosiformis TaxID=4098 RepID=UPI00051C9C4B|nr:pentatricopeptide repeat-containing protein At5g66520-like [Nicotiana tomentosiformis]
MAAASISAPVPKQNILEFQNGRGNKTPSNVLLLQMCRQNKEVKQLHSQLIISGLIRRPPNAARLVESYVGVSETDDALLVFKSSIQSPDTFAYNVMIRGLILTKRPKGSLLLYEQLCSEGLVPDSHTYTFVLKACSHLKAILQGKQVHAQIIKTGVEPNTHVCSSLISMYSYAGSMKSARQVLDEYYEDNNNNDICPLNSMITGYMNEGLVEKAKEIFDTMENKDTATWSAMLSGYTKNGMHEVALVTFQKMMSYRVPLNESSLVCTLSACGELGALDQGRWIHTYIINKREIVMSVNLGTALVDMYARCGCIEFSYQLFKNMAERDVVTWGVIISGFATHGQANKCFQLFDEMIESGVEPNGVIFVAILSACSHAGQVGQGCHYFDQMVHHFGIRPSIEHFGCMVDLLGRAGRLAEAEQLILSMPEEPNSIVLGALLNACRIHSDVERGRHLFRRLINLGPSPDRYKLAASLFANNGEGYEIRKLVKYEDLVARCGLSNIQVDGVVHEFMVSDIANNRARDIYEALGGLVDQ